MQVCAITGHRPSRFRFKHKVQAAEKRLREQMEWLCAQGICVFWVVGALGVGMWAGESLLRMKELPEYSDLELHIALPGPEHDKLWGARSKTRMAFLIRHSMECVIVGTSLTPADYRNRNQYMVDRADILLAVYDNDHSIRSGTGMTGNYACKKGHPIIFIHPDSQEVTTYEIHEYK